MTKEKVRTRVSQYGRPLALSKFRWNEDTNTFSSREHDLIIDFQGISDYTFNTGDHCTFKTGGECTFKTGWFCTFSTGDQCTFTTGGFCTFSTGDDCTFITGCDCTFNTGTCCTWVFGSKSYPFAPLFIQGSNWAINVRE